MSNILPHFIIDCSDMLTCVFFRFESCWPAIQRGSNGVMFVYNPGREDQARMLDSLYNQFAAQHGVKEAQCVVFCHHKPGAQGKGAKLCKDLICMCMMCSFTIVVSFACLIFHFSAFLSNT